MELSNKQQGDLYNSSTSLFIENCMNFLSSDKICLGAEMVRNLICGSKVPITKFYKPISVYEVPCKECLVSYIRLKGRTLTTRINEHKSQRKMPTIPLLKRFQPLWLIDTK